MESSGVHGHVFGASHRKPGHATRRSHGTHSCLLSRYTATPFQLPPTALAKEDFSSANAAAPHRRPHALSSSHLTLLVVSPSKRTRNARDLRGRPLQRRRGGVCRQPRQDRLLVV